MTADAKIDHADGIWRWSLEIDGVGMRRGGGGGGGGSSGVSNSWGKAAARLHEALSDAAVCHSAMIAGDAP